MMQTLLRTYRRRLTNLSSRNRSLLLSSLPAEQFIDLHDLDFLLNKPSFDSIAQLLAGKKTVALCPVMDARNERANVVSRKLRRIARTERFIEEERGAEDLYVGWPFVRGKFMDGRPVHGPLLFFPVHLDIQGNQWQLVRRGDSLVTINQTMLLAYAYFNQVRVAPDDVEKTFDDFDKDPLAFRTQLYEWLKTTPLAINFNQDLFTNKLQPFDTQTLKSLDLLEQTGELKLYPEAVLGIFPQAGSFLVPDYDELIDSQEHIPEESVSLSSLFRVSNLDLTNSSEFARRFGIPNNNRSYGFSPLPEQKIHTPLPMDASQEAAVRAVKAGESLVVQGPPGTGKSQLIANLMADAAAQGRRVLLVCQKRAALDVVYERLKQVGMAPYTALIHDFQNDRNRLYTQIAAQIAQVDHYREQNHSLNAVLMEREFDTESRQIDELTTELQAFKEALFDTTICGLSAKELYLSSKPGNALIDLSDLYSQFPFNEQLNRFLNELVNIDAYLQRLGPEHPWHERISFAGFGIGQLATVERTITDIPATARHINQQLTPLLNRLVSRNTAAIWQEQAWQLTALLSLLEGQEQQAVWTIAQALRLDTQHPANQISELDLFNLSQQWDKTLASGGPELSLIPSELSPFAQLLREAIDARSSWVSWQWWQATNKGKETLQRVAQANQLSLSLEDLQTLQQRLTQRQLQEALQPRIKALLANLIYTDTPQHYATLLKQIRQARELTNRFSEYTALNYLHPSVWLTASSFTDAVRTILSITHQLEQKNSEWLAYLTDAQIERLWQEGDSYADVLRRSLRADFDLLVEADRLFEGFSTIEKSVLERLTLARQSARGSKDKHERYPEELPNGKDLFLNALRLAWLHHLEQHYPNLRSVSSFRMQQMEQALQNSVRKKQALSRDILLVQLRERTYRNLTFNRLNNLITYRELHHQVTKKRNVWPVRKLMERHAEEVFRLVPCWMASPESVSAIFPLQQGQFDLVIFDEASQCFAENGIPAIYRGKQIIITGDSQQLRPSDVYRIRLDDETTDETPPVALEVESLLELAAQSLPQLSLKGHYRSRSLDLIQFSNQHFYQQQLTLLPDFRGINQQQPAIRYLNVKGTWQTHTNLAEAEAILQLITQLSTEMPGRSIGVVTFNYPQQQLIQEMLESEQTFVDRQQETQTAPESLFVKNIENVQGDERDIIIFSVGYAPDEHGRMVMQFGSLNTSGGENRLNVAITRARERVYVVTSLWPEQLAVQETANPGPKLLKAYLEFALDVAQERFRPEPRRIDGINAGILLKDQLARLNPSYRAELPFADLTVKEGNEYKGLIFTDDDHYYQQTAKETHAYIPLALQDRKWPYRREWSREFWRGANQ